MIIKLFHIIKYAVLSAMRGSIKIISDFWKNIPDDEKEKIIKEVARMFREYFAFKFDEYQKRKKGENKK